VIAHSELTLAVRDLVLAVDRYRARAGRQRGLNPSAVTAMAHLRLDGPQTPGELARRLAITTASATDLLDRLHGLGRATRQPHPDDRRKLLVDLTAAGRAEIDEILDGFAAGIAGWGEGREPDERATVLAFARETTRALLAGP
jgi:DNA-binding MarR family transcriptional regulator